MRWYYACKGRKGTVFIKGIYTSGNSQMAELVRPNIQKKIADVRAWDDIMHKVHNGIVFIKGIYSSGNSRKAELVRPNRCAMRWKKIASTVFMLYFTHEMILCMHRVHKVANGTVFIKGIYTSGNSRMAELVRPNIQKKIADTCVHEMILCIKYTTVLYLSKESILQGTHAWPSWFARTSKRK